MAIERSASLPDDARAYLMQEPWAHETLLGLASQLGDSTHPNAWWVIKAKQRVLGVLLFRPPFALNLSRMAGPALDEAMATLAPYLDAVSTIAAPAELGVQLRKGLRLSQPSQVWELWSSREPSDLEARGGLARTSAGYQTKTLAQFKSSEPAFQRPRAWSLWWAQDRVCVWLSPRGEPVAIAVRTREAAFGACIGYVYTAAAHRRRGYGRAVTAAVQSKILIAGYPRAYLHVNARSIGAKAMYDQLGFALQCKTLCWTSGDTRGRASPR